MRFPLLLVLLSALAAACGTAAPLGDGGLVASPAPSPGGSAPDPSRDPPAARTGVVVVGGGPAGLAAAAELRQAGVPHLLLERERRLGGSILWSRAPMLLFAGTGEQRAVGIADSPAALLADWSSITGGDGADPWVKAWATGAVPLVHDWLVAEGIRFHLAPEAPDAGPVPRVHVMDGPGEALAWALARRLDPGAVVLGREVTGIVVEAGRAAGVCYRDVEGGGTGWIRASAVVMATGGFLRDVERVRRARPDLGGVDLWFASAPCADGGGLRLLESVGAATRNLGAIGLYGHGVADHRRPGEREELMVPGLGAAPWVGRHGRRFRDETDSATFAAGAAVVGQPGGIAYALLDSDAAGRLPAVDAMPEPADPTTPPGPATSAAVVAETLDALAEGIGAPPDALTETVAAYNVGTLGGDAFGKDPRRIDPLDRPPYAAVRVVPALAKAFGGVAVDLSGAVVDARGIPLPGLFAAGELTGMAGGTLVGDRGFTGSLSAVIYSGRVAGRAAARGD